VIKKAQANEVEICLKVKALLLPSGHDLQSCFCVPGALSNATKDPLGHFLQVLAT